MMTRPLLAALLATALIPATAHAQAIGINAAIRNSVKMKTAADRAPRPAVLRERVSLGDEVQTGPASVDQMLLLDKSVFTVGANARVKIDRFVYDPNRGASTVAASVAKGAFRFMSGKATRGAPGTSSVNTPVASIGIRGTILEGVVGPDAIRIAAGEAGAAGAGITDPENASLIVLRGPGAAAQGDEHPGAIDVTAGGTTVAVASPGLAVFVPGPNRAPIGPFQLSDAGLDALHALLRTTPNRRRGSVANPVAINPVTDLLFERGEEDRQTPGVP